MLQSKDTSSRILIPLEPHNPVQAEVCSEIVTKGKGRTFDAKTSDGCTLRYRVVSEEERRLAVTKLVSKSKIVVIPETVIVNEQPFTVTDIDDHAFWISAIKDCQFPTTLKRIGKEAFRSTYLERVLLPVGLEEIGDRAFHLINTQKPISGLYIPTSVQVIGVDAFRELGCETSPKGYYQGPINCLPKWIISEKCIKYGIDNLAVIAYEKLLNNNNKGE